ncbi:MAG: hypothetical protein PHU66_09805 [Bacteroidaceae bacterium]|nr:hypothetical protein [Bacteroidaceae bacterium]
MTNLFRSMVNVKKSDAEISDDNDEVKKLVDEVSSDIGEVF